MIIIDKVAEKIEIYKKFFSLFLVCKMESFEDVGCPVCPLIYFFTKISGRPFGAQSLAVLQHTVSISFNI